MEIKKVYPLDAVFDTPDDVPEDVREIYIFHIILKPLISKLVMITFYFSRWKRISDMLDHQTGLYRKLQNVWDKILEALTFLSNHLQMDQRQELYLKLFYKNFILFCLMGDLLNIFRLANLFWRQRGKAILLLSLLPATPLFPSLAIFSQLWTQACN